MYMMCLILQPSLLEICLNKGELVIYLGSLKPYYTNIVSDDFISILLYEPAMPQCDLKAYIVYVVQSVASIDTSRPYDFIFILFVAVS